ncbi:hypothetical protein POM88_045071 [Heracleum sosnowskyi]|uniref:CCHC-type domain-containing protein n=1 Tax=Heracleum sosnowskyi TaxID=360622 RepID=A0AAD8H6Q8_9APIA|nr:hypothetical protein POM88_045071 [Heracleum sosnowskyi]
MGRVMHCAICSERGHKRGKCPNKPADYDENATRIRAPKRKQMTEQEAEVDEEIERAEREKETGEAQMALHRLASRPSSHGTCRRGRPKIPVKSGAGQSMLSKPQEINTISCRKL